MRDLRKKRRPTRKSGYSVTFMRIEVGRSVNLLNLAALANLAVLVSVQCLDDKAARVPPGHGMALGMVIAARCQASVNVGRTSARSAGRWKSRQRSHRDSQGTSGGLTKQIHAEGRSGTHREDPGHP
jgi:hypothetical protein